MRSGVPVLHEAILVLLTPRSRCAPERDEMLIILPGLPVLADICVPHPLSASALKDAPRDKVAIGRGRLD